jgi:hypothetical protein
MMMRDESLRDSPVEPLQDVRQPRRVDRRRLYRLGFSSVQIGSWVGLSRAWISQILAEQGVDRRRPGIRTEWASSAEAQRIKVEIDAILEDIEAAAT